MVFVAFLNLLSSADAFLLRQDRGDDDLQRSILKGRMADMIHQGIDRRSSQCLQIGIHRGEFWGGILGLLGVVISDDTDIFGDVQPQFLQRL